MEYHGGRVVFWTLDAVVCSCQFAVVVGYGSSRYHRITRAGTEWARWLREAWRAAKNQLTLAIAATVQLPLHANLSTSFPQFITFSFQVEFFANAICSSLTLTTSAVTIAPCPNCNLPSSFQYLFWTIFEIIICSHWQPQPGWIFLR